MPVNSKAIKRRIKSVNNTKKITKAMEMVSAAKMRRAVEATVNTRAYAVMARQVLDLLGQASLDSFPLLKIAPVSKMLVVLISSNRGLCGSYNANIFRKTRVLLADKSRLAEQRDLPVPQDGEEVLPRQSDVAIDIIGIGKKSADFAKKNGYPLVAVFDELGERPKFEEVLPISNFIREQYVSGAYQKVLVAYTDYKTSLVQEPRMTQLLPVNVSNIETMIATLGKTSEARASEAFPLEEYLFEPNLSDLVTSILPRLVEIQLYQTILESAASEHSARMLAMRSASDAAGDMIKELNLTYNKARQAAITQEIAEIVGGAAALE